MVVSHLSRILSGSFTKVFRSVPFQAIFCFIVMYSSLIISSIPLLLLFVYRIILSVVLKIFYKGKFQLASGSRALISSMDEPATVMNITYYIYVDGECDIERLRKRISTNILARDKTGNRPYDILLKSTTEKFGFICLSDKSDTIEFKNHVRHCPGVDPDLVHSEREFLDVVTNLADNLWDESKPKWELLVAPKVKREDSNEISCGIAIKFHHLYVDGISLGQFLRNCIFDQPCPKLSLDPVNPPIPRLSTYQRILLGLQIFFMGPYTSLRLFANAYDPVMSEGPLTGGKMMGRTKMKIPLEMMRRIRKFHKCSTQAVLNSAFIGSFAKMAERKGISLPNEIIAAIVFGNFPYPDEYPRNNQIFGFEPVSTNNVANPMVRLAEMNNCMMTLKSRTYALKASWILLRLMGLYPAALVRYLSTLIKASYYVSNVPGLVGTAKLDGNEVSLLYGTGALFNQIRYHAGSSIYGGNFQVSLYVEASKIIKNREELEEWVQEFENEIRFLDIRASAA